MLKSWVPGLLGLTGLPRGVTGETALKLTTHGVIALVPLIVGMAFPYLSNIPNQWGLTFSDKLYQYLAFKA